MGESHAQCVRVERSASAYLIKSFSIWSILVLASNSCQVNTSSFVSKDSFSFEIELSFFLV